MPKYFSLKDDLTFDVVEAETWAAAYYKAKVSPAHQPTVLCEQEMRDLQDNIGHVLNAASAVMTPLNPCRSQYCECEAGKCTHPGRYDTRGTAP